MIGQKEILRRFQEWVERQGETFTREDLIAGVDEMFPEVPEAEATAITKVLIEVLTNPVPRRKPLSGLEIRYRLNDFIASRPVGSPFTIEEVVSEVFPDLDEATAREAAYWIADDLERRREGRSRLR